MELKLPKFFTQKKVAHLPMKSLFSSPVRVWHTILIVFAVAVIGVVIFDGILFYRIGNDTFLESENNKVAVPELIDRTKLDRVLHEYQKKVDQFYTYSTRAPDIIDPSR